MSGIKKRFRDKTILEEVVLCSRCELCHHHHFEITGEKFPSSQMGGKDGGS